MFSLRGLLIASLVPLVCSFANVQFTSEARILLKNYTLPHAYPVLYNVGDIKVIDNAEDSFAFLACQFAHESVQQSCNVTVETWRLYNDHSWNTCENISMSSDGEEDYRYHNNDLWPVTPNRVIIQSLVYLKNASIFHPESNIVQLQLLILDMPTCSIVTRLRLPMDNNIYELQSDFMLYHDSFELIVAGSDKCGDQLPRCRITYDIDGKRIGDPKAFEVPKKYITLAASHQTPDKGYYSLDADSRHPGKWAVFYSDPSGRTRELMSDIPLIIYPLETRLLTGITLFDAHELFGICWLDIRGDDINLYISQLVRCVQFDTQKARLNFTLELPYNSTWVAARSLFGGDLLVAMGKNCEINLEAGSIDCLGMRVQRIAADGQQRYGALDVDGLQIRSDDSRSLVQHKIYEKSSGEICLFWSWKGFENENTNLSYKTWCIPANSTLIPKKKQMNAA